MNSKGYLNSFPLVHCTVSIPVNKEQIIFTKCFNLGWSGITYQNNNEARKQDQGTERETDL